MVQAAKAVRCYGIRLLGLVAIYEIDKCLKAVNAVHYRIIIFNITQLNGTMSLTQL